MEKSSPRGILLDLDGTLADSMPVLAGVYMRFLEVRGRQGTTEEFHELAGFPMLQCVAMLKNRHDLPGDTMELLHKYYELTDEVYQTEAQPTHGARELLMEARARDVAVAVVTAARAVVAQGFLRNHGLEGMVSAVVGVESTRRCKPHPDPYIKGLEMLSLLAPQALAVEDTAPGAAAALAAGIPVYVIGPPGRWPQVPGAAGQISRLDELIALLPS